MIAEALFDGEALAFERHYLRGGLVPVAGREVPGFLHALGLHTDDGADLAAGFGDPGAAQEQRPAVARHPILGGLRLAGGDRHLHDAAEASDEVEADLVFEKLAEALGTKATLGEDRELHSLGQDLAEALEEHVLVLVPPALQLGLHDRLPEQRRGPTLDGDHRQDDGGLVVVVEVGPVERRDDLRPVADDDEGAPA